MGMRKTLMQGQLPPPSFAAGGPNSAERDPGLLKADRLGLGVTTIDECCCADDDEVVYSLISIPSAAARTFG